MRKKPKIEPDVTGIFPNLRRLARQALDRGDVAGFLGYADNTDGLYLVTDNTDYLLEAGLFERALVEAYVGTRTNNFRWPESELKALFAKADRSKLLAVGDPLPGPGPFVLYRGVAGKEKHRRIRGISWTNSCREAEWFAGRYLSLGIEDPAVYVAEVPASCVMAYLKEERQEQEFLLDLKDVPGAGS